MLEWIAATLSWVLILIGCVFIVSGGIGMLRLPDLYTRLHASSVTDTGGAMFILAGLIIQSLLVYGSFIVTGKLALILVFTLFTAPTASHALAKTALLTGQVPVDGDGKSLLDSPESAAQLAQSVRGRIS